jgi:hypothetical protein
MKKQENVELVIRNARVKYAKVHRPGKPYDESQAPSWEVNIYPTDEDAETLKAHGVNPKEDKDGNEYWIAKRSTKTKAGDDAKPPVVVDARKAPFTEDIGNKSVCNVAVTLFPWEKGKKRGVLVYLQAVQVVNLVPYGASGADAFGVVDTGDVDPADVF